MTTRTSAPAGNNNNNTSDNVKTSAAATATFETSSAMAATTTKSEDNEGSGRQQQQEQEEQEEAITAVSVPLADLSGQKTQRSSSSFGLASSIIINEDGSFLRANNSFSITSEESSQSSSKKQLLHQQHQRPSSSSSSLSKSDSAVTSSLRLNNNSVGSRGLRRRQSSAAAATSSSPYYYYGEMKEKSIMQQPQQHLPQQLRTRSCGNSIGSEVSLMRMSLELEREARIIIAQKAMSGGGDGDGKNRLRHRFESLHPAVVGRDNEIKTLRVCWNRINNETGRKELVLIHGPSGSGKTTLMKTFLFTQQRNSSTKTAASDELRVIIARGKYDEERRNNGQPLVGIAQACNELCREILRTKDKELRTHIREDLRNQIDGPLLDILGQTIIPSLHLLLSNDDEGIDRKHRLGQQHTNHKPPPPTPDASTAPVASGGENGELDIGTTEAKNTIISGNHERETHKSGVTKLPIQFSLKSFLRIVASNFRHAGFVVAIALDDLHWADSISLDMIQAIMSDPEISNILTIGSYRSSAQPDLADDHKNPPSQAFLHFLSNLKDQQRAEQSLIETKCCVTEVAIGNLTPLHVQELVAKVLSAPAEEVLGLSQLCHRRTLGNPFFVKHFLISLEENQLLTYCHDNGEYTWELPVVEEETAASDNVVDLIQRKLSTYSQNLLLLLQFVAVVGGSIDLLTLELLWLNFSWREPDESSTGLAPTGTTDSLSGLLGECLQEMLLEPLGHTPEADRFVSYRIVHDNLKDSILSLIPADKRNSFRKEVGRCLFFHFCEKDVGAENLLFVIADLLNYDEENRADLELAELNLMAAETAMEFSAFSTSLQYVESGLKCLNGLDTWSHHPELALHLHSTGAEAAESAGNSEKSIWFCNQVQQQEQLSILDKMRVFHIIVEGLYRTGAYDELWSTCMDVLDALGCKLPRNQRNQQLKATLALQKTKRVVPSSAEVEEMALIQSPMRREALEFMIKAASFGMGSNRKSLYILLCCKCVGWTKKYGITESTASTFASFANVLMHETGDWETALMIGELALQLENRFGSSYTKTSTLQKINTFVFGWVKPLRNCLADYNTAYKLGMLSGNIEGVGMAVLFLHMCQFFSGGTSLSSLDEDLKKYIPQLEKLELHTYALGLRLLWQKVLNLLGPDQHNSKTTELVGTAMDGIDIEKHPFIYKTAGRHHIVNLCACVSEYEKGAAIAIDMGDIFYKTWSGAAYYGFETFSRAVCLYAMAIKSNGKAKYWTPARKARAEIAKWVKLGALNLVHQLHLLEAEDAVVRSKDRQARRFFHEAIKGSVRGGFLGDAGISNERYALYLDSLTNHDDDASHHMKEAVKYFSEWGALEKVRRLKEEHQGLLDRMSMQQSSCETKEEFK